MVNENQVIDEALEDAPGFNIVGLIITTASLSFLASALFIPTLQSANPITYYTKTYVETGTTCSLGKLNNFFFNDQVALKLNQTKNCLDTLIYPIESDEYQILIRNIQAIEKLNPEKLLSLEYRNIIESNLNNIDLQRAEKSIESKSQRWFEVLLLSGGLTFVVLFFLMMITYRIFD